LAAGALAAGLQAGAAAPDDPDVLAELAQHLVVAAAETLARRRQHDDRDHPPEDAEHREAAAQLVGAQILQRLDERFSHRATRLGFGIRDSGLERFVDRDSRRRRVTARIANPKSQIPNPDTITIAGLPCRRL